MKHLIKDKVISKKTSFSLALVAGFGLATVVEDHVNDKEVIILIGCLMIGFEIKKKRNSRYDYL
jgi:hypothetical protein